MKPSTIWKMIALALGAGLLASVLVACGSNPAGLSDAGGITVSATSEVKVVPDKARINVSVITEDKQAEACRTANAEAVDAVMKELVELGVAKNSVQTSYANLSPRYGSKSGESDEDWSIVGYEMNTRLTVSDLDIDNVSTAVQACVAAGANGADGIEYYASNYDETYNNALAQAIETAKVKAEGIAQATGVRLGKVTNVSEGYQDTSYRYVDSLDAGMVADEEVAAGSAVAKTMPGQVGITAEVTVTYAIA